MSLILFIFIFKRLMKRSNKLTVLKSCYDVLSILPRSWAQNLVGPAVSHIVGNLNVYVVVFLFFLYSFFFFFHCTSKSKIVGRDGKNRVWIWVQSFQFWTCIPIYLPKFGLKLRFFNCGSGKVWVPGFRILNPGCWVKRGRWILQACYMPLLALWNLQKQ